jgi:serine/threonine protein kinase/Flp pilus assembly protein TadD
MIGKTISHYKILEKLGEGGMGVVYKAKDTKLDRIVALKFLPKHLLYDKEAKGRFVHEAKAASALDHPNIATIYEIDEAQGECFICMAYIEGQSLKELIRQKKFSLEEILRIATQISEGLHTAHKKGITHRDIKSDNIMLTPEGTVKIMDFGLAKLKGAPKLTKTGTTTGTMQYMSPEQAQGMEVDQRSDIFSLAVVLYEMITGQLPFKGDHEAAIIYSIVNETPEPLARYKVNIPEGLQKIVDKALKKDLSTRYQSTADMVADLKGLQKETTTGVSIPSKKKTISQSIIFIGIAIVIVIAAYAILSGLWAPSGTGPTPGERKSIAVLPFKNMVPDPENDWFSDGITEDIITQLSKIGDLKVISRTSIMLYKDSKKNLRQIGEELGVATILEGSVRRADSRVRIVSQLIDAQTDEHIWAETYDRDLKDIFAIQSDVAQQIAQALKATLSPEEKERIRQKPTDNLEAYDYYLKAREYEARSYEKRDLEIAIELFEKAVTADPNFAEAFASLSRQHCRMYWYGHDRSPERLARAKETIDKALNLKPDEPIVRLANGYYYYWGFRDYARALDEFSFCLQKEPGNSWNFSSIAWIQRRLGKFEEALKNLKTAFQLNPREHTLAKELAYTCEALRMYTEAESYYGRAISLAPDRAASYTGKAWIQIYKTGSTKGARQVLDEASKYVSLEDITWSPVYLDIYDGYYQDALDKLASIQKEVEKGNSIYTPKEAIVGSIYELMGQLDQAEAHYKKALLILEKKRTEWPDDPRIHADLGKVYAHLGLKDQAIAEAQKAVDLIPVSKDAMAGPQYLAYLAEILTILGEYDAAIEKLDYLLEIPAGVHIGDLKVEPVWAPLRDHPRFQKLLKKYE